MNFCLNFSKSFPSSKVIKLEQNYRSTKIILDAAHHVVSKNINRADKKLWTDNKRGEQIGFYEFENDVLKIINEKNSELNDIVLLYRTNSQSRAIEDRLRRESVPYHIVGGVKFYDRKEIKDILAYLRYVLNPKDALSLLRIVNFPPRGIGKSVTDKIISYINENNCSIEIALKELEKMNLSPKQIEKVQAFSKIIKNVEETLDSSALETLELLLDKIEVEEYYRNKDNPDDYDRIENIQEFVSSVSDFCERNDENSMQLFIEEVSLLTDIDKWNANDQKLTLMTLHSSKGLEFNHVYILGLEEGLLPLSHNDDDDDIEEERRLFYVGLTRGIEKVTLTYANSRRRFGAQSMFSLKSSFIDLIPEELFSQEIKQEKVFMKTSHRTESSNISDKFETGNKVTHKLYGAGTILKIEGLGDNAKITIRFRGNLIKKFIKKYANLKKTF